MTREELFAHLKASYTDVAPVTLRCVMESVLMATVANTHGEHVPQSEIEYVPGVSNAARALFNAEESLELAIENGERHGILTEFVVGRTTSGGERITMTLKQVIPRHH